MSQLKELISIDKRFQNSINIQLDMENERKNNSYIPTRSAMQVLNQYLHHIAENRDKANILIGPYGKGKSHLLLVLLYLLSQERDDKTETIIQKIAKVSPETAETAGKLRESKCRMLPVVVSGMDGNLNQAFLLGLTDALKRRGMTEIAPESSFGEAIKMLLNWKENYPLTYQQLETLLQKKQSGIKTARQLQECLQVGGKVSQDAYRLFQQLYPELTSGGIFQPLVQMDALKVYKEISVVLKEQYGYSGIYIVFDEFSKYIEGHERETFSRDMKIVQDMCELAQNSRNPQIHITFVAHKSIKEYGAVLSKEMINAFTGVEGRLKEERFIVSSQNNYELIENVIHKNSEEYRKWLEETQIKSLTEQIYQKIPYFGGVMEREEYEEIIVRGCFPLLPLTAYSLLAISEKVAQNERSIFTFLANQEPGSLVFFVEHHRATEPWYVQVDAVYDYFKNLFRESWTTPAIRTEWLKADYALERAGDEREKKFLKTLAVLRMIHRPEEVPVNDDGIRLACAWDGTEYEAVKQRLLDKKLIIYRNRLHTYSFINNVGVDLDKEIRETAAKIQMTGGLETEFSKIAELEYVLPKQYNQEYTMTRYFHYEYLSAEQFLKIGDSRYLFDEREADGKLVALIWTQRPDFEELRQHLIDLDDERVVLLVPRVEFSKEQQVRKLLAVQTLLHNQDFLEQNKVLEQELRLYEEDLRFEINAELEELYMPENEKTNVYYGSEVHEKFRSAVEFNRFLSQICGSYYELAPRINNELINRQEVSAQIKKARDKIVEEIFAEGDFSRYQKGTSPEATIYRATRNSTGTQGVLDAIDGFIQNCEGTKRCFGELYETLMGKKLGTRKGILPIFLARKLVMLQGTPVIYLQDKEVELSAVILNNLNDRPKEYFLYIEPETIQKEHYLQTLEQMFQVKLDGGKGNTKGKRLSEILRAMQKWYRSLPQYTLTCQNMRTEEQVDFEQIKGFRGVFRKLDLNPREVLFERLPQIFDEESAQRYPKTEAGIQECKRALDYHLAQEEHKVAERIKELLRADAKESLWGCLTNWYAGVKEQTRNQVLNDRINGFLNELDRMKTHDESEITERITKSLVDIYIDDWNDQSFDLFCREFENVRDQVEQFESVAQSQMERNKISFYDSEGKSVEKYYEPGEEDSTSYFLKNAIEDALEEFGDTLETNQKVSILVQTLEKLIRE